MMHNSQKTEICYKKKIVLETVSIQEKEHLQTVISSTNGTTY